MSGTKVAHRPNAQMQSSNRAWCQIGWRESLLAVDGLHQLGDRRADRAHDSATALVWTMMRPEAGSTKFSAT